MFTDFVHSSSQRESTEVKPVSVLKPLRIRLAGEEIHTQKGMVTSFVRGEPKGLREAKVRECRRG